MENSLIKELPTENELKRQIMLTSAIVWRHELSGPDIENWLSNFKGEVFDQIYERRLALWLLANFVYYNEDEVRHLCKTLFREFIHKILLEIWKPKEKIEDFYKTIINDTRFHLLGKPSESSGFILYFFRQENELPTTNFIYDPDNLPANIKYIVFVDDVTLSMGSDSQAIGYIENEKKKYKDKRIILLTLIASEKAIQFLQSIDIMTIATIKLNDTNKCFSKNSEMFIHFQKHSSNCKKIAEYYGKKIEPTKYLGWADGQLAFSFFYNTPDNTLPIFWSTSKGWMPIIKRYPKKTIWGGLNNERFV